MLSKLHLVIGAVLILLRPPAHSQIPAQLSYQGRVTVGGVNFTGTGQFKFALVDGGVNLNQTATATAIATLLVTSVAIQSGGSGYFEPPEVTIAPPDQPGGVQATASATIAGGVVTGITITAAGLGYSSNSPLVTIAPPPANIEYQTYWSNVGDLAPGEVPGSSVPIAVTNGLYSVRLGDPALGMAPFHADTFQSVPLFLRVWFSDGVHGFQQLTPDQPLAAAPYAFTSQLALTVPNGSISRFQLADGAVTSFKLADEAVSAVKIAPGAVTASSLGDGAVGASKLAAGAVTSAVLAPGAAAVNLNAGGNQAVTLGTGSFTGPLRSGAGVSATGLYSMAIGENTGAAGQASLALGTGSDAIGSSALAFGINCQAVGPGSLAGGEGTLAISQYSVALGKDTVASGFASMAIGQETVAAMAGGFACGAYNNGVVSVFSVGIGSGPGISRRNGFSVDVDGDAAVFRDLSYGGSLIHTSDARLKDLGAPFATGLGAIARIEPLHYRFKKDNAKNLPSEPEQIGVVAQALREVLPEAVAEDTDGYLAVKQEPVIWALVNAVKELKAENDGLRARLERLEQGALPTVQPVLAGTGK